MPTPANTPQRALLARRLRELRATAFPSGSAMARNLGWHQTRVSKLEQGSQRPTDEDLRRWGEAAGATAEQLAELFALASAARIEYATFGQRYRQHGGAVGEQESTAQDDNASTRIAEFQPAMIPGLLQTAAYAHEVLTRPCGPTSAGVSDEGIDQIVGKRMDRQQILYQPRQQPIQLVMGEAALHTHFGNPRTLAGQLDRLLALIGHPQVDIAVVPFTAPMPVFPLTNFLLYDDHVLIESLTAQQRLDSPDDIHAYEDFFQQLRDAALTNHDLEALLLRITTEHRQNAGSTSIAPAPRDIRPHGHGRSATTHTSFE